MTDETKYLTRAQREREKDIIEIYLVMMIDPYYGDEKACFIFGQRLTAHYKNVLPS